MNAKWRKDIKELQFCCHFSISSLVEVQSCHFSIGNHIRLSLFPGDGENLHISSRVPRRHFRKQSAYSVNWGAWPLTHSQHYILWECMKRLRKLLSYYTSNRLDALVENQQSVIVVEVFEELGGCWRQSYTYLLCVGGPLPALSHDTNNHLISISFHKLLKKVWKLTFCAKVSIEMVRERSVPGSVYQNPIHHYLFTFESWHQHQVLIFWYI